MQAFLTQLSNPAICVKLGIFIIIFVLAIKSIFFLGLLFIDDSESQQIKKIHTLTEKLNTTNKSNAELIALTEKLPKFSDQVDYATSYFASYGLKLEPVKDWQDNQQPFRVSGSLNAVILSIYDTKQTQMLLKFGQILIKPKYAKVEFLIFGRADE